MGAAGQWAPNTPPAPTMKLCISTRMTEPRGNDLHGQWRRPAGRAGHGSRAMRAGGRQQDAGGAGPVNGRLHALDALPLEGPARTRGLHGGNGGSTVQGGRSANVSAPALQRGRVHGPRFGDRRPASTTGCSSPCRLQGSSRDARSTHGCSWGAHEQTQSPGSSCGAD